MATEAAAQSIISPCFPLPFSKSCLSPKLPYSVKLRHASNSTPPLLYNFTTTRKLYFQVCSTVQETTVQETKPEQTQKQNIIKHKDGKNRNFVFVTMASAEEAQAAVNQFDTQEVSGRIIRVEFAKKFKKPRPQRSASPPAKETGHKLYVSNLAWKVRSSHLREFFSANFNPLSSKVVFESNEGRSAGYGFVSFSTKEEAEAAISSLDGKELMGRPLRLKFSQRNGGVSESDKEEEGVSDDGISESNKQGEDVSEDQPAEP